MKRHLLATIRLLSTPVLRAGRTVRAQSSSNPVGFLLVMALLFGLTAFAWSVSHQPSKDDGLDPNAPLVTYTGSWNLLDLTRHLEAGDVLVISRFSDTTGSFGRSGGGARPGALAAQTRDGQWVKLDLDQTPIEAVAALRALGYGRILSTEALQTLSAADPSAAASPDSPVNFLLFLTALMLGTAIILFAVRGRSMGGGRGIGRSGSRSSHFTVILPPDPENESDSAAERLSHLPMLVDIAGVDEAKLELTEIIDFLKDPTPFAALGAEIPRGLLLYGPPGTGKTSLAKAIAREAGVGFIHTSGSDFVEMYVGNGARRVRDLFTEARKLTRAVVFIDEFDALGKARGGPNRHEESEHTLNQLLKEMDGFDTTSGVIVVAATNRHETLDPALLRPGRFGRKVHVPLPDRAGREAILAVHAANKPLSPAVELSAVARRTFGFSGAMLKDILNEAAILAARRKSAAIEPAEIAAGWLKVAMGVSRTRSMEDRERSIIAVHEAGHAICGRVHGDKRKIEKISLRAHGDALGFTAFSSEDDALPAESGLRARLIALMGGRAAEAMLFHENTGGAQDDFKNAHALAETMVRRLGMGRDPSDETPPGMSGRGILSFLVDHDEGYHLPASILEAQTRAVAALLDEAYAAALSTLSSERERLEVVAAYLYEAEEIDGDEFDALMDDRLVPQSLSAWRTDASHPRSPQEIADMLAQRSTPARPASPKPVVIGPAPVRPRAVPPAIIPTPAQPTARINSRPSWRGLLGSRLRRRAITILQAWEDRGRTRAS